MNLYYNVINILVYYFISDVIFFKKGIEIMSEYNKILHTYIHTYIRNNCVFLLCELFNKKQICESKMLILMKTSK